jgi:ankyrin repeat protein
LDETYNRILHAIPPEHKKTATFILQLIAFSERPLKVEEVVDAIAVDTDRDLFFCPKYRMPDPREITRYCSSLVIVTSIPEHFDENNGSYAGVQLAHFSVKEYLTSNRLDSDVAPNFQEPAARAAIARACLAYLLHFNEELPANDLVQRYPFAQYSARYWIAHAAEAKDKDNRTLELTKQLFLCRKISYNICYGLHRPDTPWLESYSLTGKPASAMYYAALGGLIHTAKELADQGVNVNAHGGYYGNALQAASSGGHTAIVKLLLEKGAYVNAQGGQCGNALYVASSRGHEAIVKLLVEKGADVNTQDGVYGNALYAASSGGHTAIVKLLLEKGADVNAQGGHFGNALYAASSGGHTAIVKLLLEKGADVNAQGGVYGNALQAASSGGHKATTKLLLEKGADVNAQGGEHGNALYLASTRGHATIVKLLLDKGADINAQGGEYGNALHGTISTCSVPIVRLLLDRGADPAARDQHGWTPSMIAFQTDNREIQDIFGVHGYDSLSGQDECLAPSILTATRNSTIQITSNGTAAYTSMLKSY